MLMKLERINSPIPKEIMINANNLIVFMYAYMGCEKSQN